MKITAELQLIKRDNNMGLSAGKYLSVSINNSGKPSYIDIDEFVKNCKPKKSVRNIVLPAVIAIGQDNIDENIQTQTSRPDYTVAMNYLKETIGINDTYFNDDENELIIESNFGNFLDLPWEDLKSNICVFRRIFGGKRFTPNIKHNNLIFLISYADKNNDGEQGILKTEIKDEVVGIASYLLDSEPKFFRIENIHMQKHMTKEKINSIKWSDYSFVHIIMHTTEKGELCFENPDMDRYKESDSVSPREFIKIFKNKRILLLFLSTCYSGGGVKDDDCLAFQVVYSGIAEHAIGYRYGIKEKLAASFSKMFYRLLSNGHELNNTNQLELIYKQALAEYYKENPESKIDNYIPIMYTNH